MFLPPLLSRWRRELWYCDKFSLPGQACRHDIWRSHLLRSERCRNCHEVVSQLHQEPRGPQDVCLPRSQECSFLPSFPKICALVTCYDGPAEKGEQHINAITNSLPAPIFQFTGPMPFTAIQTLFDPLLPAGMQWYWKGDYVKELPDEAIEAHLKMHDQIPDGLSLMHLYPINVRRMVLDMNFISNQLFFVLIMTLFSILSIPLFAGRRPRCGLWINCLECSRCYLVDGYCRHRS